MNRFIERWRSYRPSKSETFWTGATCIVATLLVGFSLGGWVTGGTANEMAEQAAAGARNELAAAVCVDEFVHAQDAATRLEKLKKEVWYQRTGYISEGGWATMPDRKTPNHRVAEMCADKLGAMEIPGASARVSSK